GSLQAQEKALQDAIAPQWSPVFATGVTLTACPGRAEDEVAAMEPGLRDRGHAFQGLSRSRAGSRPQWSPVFATGVTARKIYVPSPGPLRWLASGGRRPLAEGVVSSVVKDHHGA